MLTPAGLALLHTSESLRLVAYQDVAGVWTIGWGTTRYPDGRPVQDGDTCTLEQADAWCEAAIRAAAAAVERALVPRPLLSRQRDALISLVYNIGGGAYLASTLAKVVRRNPDDPHIRDEFMRWHWAGGRERAGLWARRHREADHYFGVTTPLPPHAWSAAHDAP